MPVAKLSCPKCQKVLKPTKPLPAGKKINCPKCGAPFVVPGKPEPEEDKEESRPAKKPAPAAKKAAPAPKKAPAAPAPKKAGPEAPKPKPGEDEDDGSAYRVLDEPGAADEDKPEIDYVPDLTVKDPRGPAAAMIVTPSNCLLGLGGVLIVASILSLAYWTWPFMFAEDMGVDPAKAVKPKASSDQDKFGAPKEKEGAKKEVKKEDLKDDEKKTFDDLVEEEQLERGIWGGVSFAALIFAGVLAFAAVKMQNLESHGWSMAAAIMAMISVVGLPFGLFALTTLQKPEVKAGFEYEPEY